MYPHSLDSTRRQSHSEQLGEGVAVAGRSITDGADDSVTSPRTRQDLTSLALAWHREIREILHFYYLVNYKSQLRMVCQHTNTGQYGHQYGDCNSYESDSQSAKFKSRLAPRVTNKRSTRKTSLVTVTVLSERTNLSKYQLQSRI